ncbi:MAG: metallophosphoesterase [Rikenellaceae bacterium]
MVHKVSLILILSVAIIDLLALWRLQFKAIKIFKIVGATALLNLLIIGTAFARMVAGDISTTTLQIQMWVFAIFMIVTIPRIGFYLVAVWRRNKHSKIAGAFVAAALFATMVWSATYGRTNIEIKEVEIASTKIPEAFDGYRIAQITDIHVGTLASPKRELQNLVETINKLDIDMVAITGDLVHMQHSELTPEIMQILAGIDGGTDGVISVLGNHDIGTYANKTGAESDQEEAEMIEKQEQMGWKVLQDETITIRRGGKRITVSGIAYKRGQHIINTSSADVTAAYLGVPKSLFNITLVHMPQLWHSVKELGYGGLTLAGHVHAMQTKIKLFGREYSPAQFLYKEWSGLYSDNEKESNLYINDGFGYVVYPMRIGTRPEITLFTLRHIKQ